MASRSIANIQREEYQTSHRKKGGGSSSVSFEPKPSYFTLSGDETDTEGMYHSVAITKTSFSKAL